VWYHSLQESFPFLFGVKEAQAVPILIDNRAALTVANHDESSPRTRHILLREFRIRDFHEAGQIRPFWCPGTHNVADMFTMFTKLVGKTIFHRLAYLMGMRGENQPHLALPDLPTLPGGKPSVGTRLSAYLVCNDNIDGDLQLRWPARSIQLS